MADAPEPRETFISWNDDGIFIYCRKPSCMKDGMMGMFEIQGYELQPRDIHSAFMQHRVDHCKE